MKTLLPALALILSSSISFASTLMLPVRSPGGETTIAISETVSGIFVSSQKNAAGNFEVRVSSQNAQCLISFATLAEAMNVYAAAYAQIENPRAVISCGLGDEPLVRNGDSFARSTSGFSFSFLAPAIPPETAQPSWW